MLRESFVPDVGFYKYRHTNRLTGYIPIHYCFEIPDTLLRIFLRVSTSQGTWKHNVTAVRQLSS
jgi:hypothetical protein